MSSRQIVRRNTASVPTYGRPALWGLTVAQRNALRNVVRMAYRNRRRISRGARAARDVARKARDAIVRRNRHMNAPYRINNKKYYKVQGIAGGTTHTTTRLIVKKHQDSKDFCVN